MPLCFIVEDHGDTREGYAEFLEASGFAVRTASAAEQFRQLIKQNVPDVILMDLRLPRTDGWQLTREIRHDPRVRHVPVIVVSASVLVEDRALAQEAGCDAFLPKPCDLDVILDTIRRLTSAHQ